MCNINWKFDYCGININSLTLYLIIWRLKLNDIPVIIIQNVWTAVYIIDPTNLKIKYVKIHLTSRYGFSTKRLTIFVLLFLDSFPSLRMHARNSILIRKRGCYRGGEGRGAPKFIFGNFTILIWQVWIVQSFWPEPPGPSIPVDMCI